MKGSKKPSGKPGDADTPSPTHYKVQHDPNYKPRSGGWAGKYVPADGPGVVNQVLLKAGLPAAVPARPKTPPPATSRAGRHLSKVKAK